MASLTAMELGADTCALARTAARDEDVRVFAVEVLDPASYSGPDAFALALREARRARKMPRRTRVVLWGVREGAQHHDAAVKPLLAPLRDAGFRVERVVSPCNALAALARVRAPRGEGATCWLAVNRAGVAIVVVRPGKQLYAHSFVWDSKLGASGSQARLLQRYSLVSVLAPEVKRAMAEARKQGTPVGALITCGNLPDLRSLTMPLIEELDLEVETLDSLDGLNVPPALAEQIAEVAPAIRLACAATVARESRMWDGAKRRATHRLGALVKAAALLAGLIAIAFAWYYYRAPGNDARGPTIEGPSPNVEGRGSATAGSPTPAPPALHASAPATDKPVASSAGPEVEPPPPATAPAPAPLKDPVPRITAVLVANDRRFATTEDGRVVGVGDVLGRRTVVAIAEKSLILREPSGVQIRVGLGGRVLGVGRGR